MLLLSVPICRTKVGQLLGIFKSKEGIIEAMVEKDMIVAKGIE